LALIFTKPLPGKAAQIKMAPLHRRSFFKEELYPANAQQSAVLALLTPANSSAGCAEACSGLLEYQVLLIRRNIYPGVHSGQISFPGGKSEEGDAGFWGTACRETREETGIAEQDIEKIGPLSSLYVQASNFIINPFLALNHSREKPDIDTGEVAGYKFIPLSVFDPSLSILLDFEYPGGQKHSAPAWRYADYTIWGATAMILAELYHIVSTGGLCRL
jgi:8-oxo-dGTP pyrophosphatase MutT (NUDIX family)